MASNKSIRDFFKPKPAAMEPSPTVASPAFKVPSVPAMRSSNIPLPNPQMAPQPSSAPKSSDQRTYTSSLSPPPSSDSSERPQSQQTENVPFKPLPTKFSSKSEIQNSDDEDDSDDSLEDLSTILAARFPNSASRSKTSGDKPTPSTPAPRYKTRTNNFHISPLPVLSKKKFDLKSLASHEQDDEAAEVSSKRYKAMLEEPDIDEDDGHSLDSAKRGKFNHTALLESVVAGGEEGGAHRVARAIQRTEATVTEQRWYFFETGANQSKPEQKPFPVALVPPILKDILVDPQMRQQTFIFGFAEDLVAMGQELPDELFLWMLDEVSVEARDPLRTAYLSVMRQSHEQIKRLITIDAIWSMFLRLGASPKANLIEVMKPVNKLKDPYPRKGWANLLSIIKFFSQVAKLLDEKSRRFLIFLFLKMSLDRMVSENVDIHDSVQDAIAQLCRYIIDWKETCILVCENLFKSTTSAPFRLQIIEGISSISPRTHDLRRRLAICFFHNNNITTYASQPGYHSTNLNEIMATLQTSRFQIKPQKDDHAGTDYHELRALIYLLDAAIDDGLSSERDLSDKLQEEMHNEDVEEFGRQLDWIGSKIQTGGAAFFTRLDTKEALTLVQQRAVAMLRTKPKPKNEWYNGGEERRVESFGREKKGMASFLKKKPTK
ncbi:hypothetical protein BKA65DRAFT_28225 [Rhexocercosporidium sp. MPI-PUGE-AT-0058]|nr:hypothetical protein BKA65DRAFT_28225 [Rhexocercosporidium sp. MPI-PUGE-AT-0058]